MPKKIILASRSPRRVELLKLITEDFIAIPSNFDESKIKIEKADELVRQLSFHKAKTVFDENENAIVIGCDTVVCLENRIFGIPQNKEEAKETLQKLSGETHQVITGVCIMDSEKTVQFEVQAGVEFYPLASSEIDEYIETGEPFDKAGGYGIQGKGALFVSSISGDYFTIVGLPVARLKRELDAFL